MYYVPDGTTRCGYYECKECNTKFLHIKIVPAFACPYCSKEPDMEIGPDEEMPEASAMATLIDIIEGEEAVEQYDALLSLAVTGGDFNWI